MKKYFLLTFIVAIGIKSYSQAFEHGYFINNSDQTTTCLIKTNWINNPTVIEYKLSPDANTQKADIETLKEFGIKGAVKYVRAVVQIDKASNQMSSMTTSKDVVFKEEKIFLKVLIEGQASLYQYIDARLTRFFYSINDGAEIKQLIQKDYLADNNIVKQNNYFRQQLFSDLSCQSITVLDIEKLMYKKKDLEPLFKSYNECVSSNYVAYKNEYKSKKSFFDYFNLSIKPGVNYSSLSLKTYDNEMLNTDFENMFS